MKDPKLSDKLSFIVYEYKKSPRFFEVSKRSLRAFFVLFPTISTIFLIAGLIGIFQLHLVSHKGTTINSGDRTVNALEQMQVQLKELADERNKLLEKLQSPENAASNQQFLFKIPKAQSDLTTQALFQMDEVKLSSTDNETTATFNLVNITKDNQKITGHFHVMLKTAKGFFFFPKNLTQTASEYIAFSDGEQFTTSRFRPVVATFPIGKNELLEAPQAVILKVFVFSRTGDLIFVKSMTPTL